jgi:prevent-host-death family protein
MKYKLEGGKGMEITAKQLRAEPGKILEYIRSGHEAIITYRGKASARIIPMETEKQSKEIYSIAGLWADREDIADVDQYVRDMRKGRRLC